MAKVKTYIVTHPKGVDLAPGHFGLGETVYHPWVDEPTGLGVGRLISMGYVAHVGEVDEAEVPEVVVEEPTASEPVTPAEPEPVETGSLEERMAQAMARSRVEATERADADAAHNAEVARVANAAQIGDVSTETRDGIAALANAGADGLPDERIPDAELAGYLEQPATTIPVVVAYATANPDQLEAVVDAEKRGKNRTTLLTALKALIP